MQKRLETLALFLLLIIFSCKTTHLNKSIMLPAFDKEGHRGCRGLMPENTLPAMLKAIDLGVTTIEMDVSFTKDSQAILSHEPFFNHDITTLPGGSFIKENEISSTIFKDDLCRGPALRCRDETSSWISPPIKNTRDKTVAHSCNRWRREAPAAKKITPCFLQY
jgi:hypothetical protein